MSARAFGARFDGIADDTKALQLAIDAAAKSAAALVLPVGTARISSPLDLRGRNLAVSGSGMGKSILRATVPMSKLIDAEESSDTIISPFELEDLTLDGNSQTVTNLAIRYRHHTSLRNLLSINAKVGIWERDTWLSRRQNCRVQDNDIGWHLVGSNHRSLWESCTFVGARQAHLLIQGKGAAADGNMALLFRSCDVEFGAEGIGIDIAAGCTVTFDTCYLGEAINGDILRNRGNTIIRGGVLFFGGAPQVPLVRPLGGRLLVEGSTINGQQHAHLGSLVGLDRAEASRPHGRVAFRGIEAQFPVGGNPTIQGDVLDYGPRAEVFAPRLGRNWTSTAFAAVVRDGAPLPNAPDARSAICSSVTGGNPLIGLAAKLTSTAWKRGDPLYLLLVYSSTNAVRIHLSGGAMGVLPTMVIGEAPPSLGMATYVKVDVPVADEAFRYLELVMAASEGAKLTLYEAFLADSRMINKGQGVLGNLYKC